MPICKLDNYLDTAYREKPKTDYPRKLSQYIMDKTISTGSLLDVGCGLGHQAEEFHDLGFEVSGCDIYDKQKKKMESQGIKFKKVDFMKEKLPYKSESFDIVFCKSVIEHLERETIFDLFKEVKRVLKKNGKFVIITPYWNFMRKYFYDDVSHITPFNDLSLKQTIQLTGFSGITTSPLVQLPFIWKLPNFVSKIIVGFFSSFPDSLRTKSQLIRSSKEVMLLGIIEK